MFNTQVATTLQRMYWGEVMIFVNVTSAPSCL